MMASPQISSSSSSGTDTNPCTLSLYKFSFATSSSLGGHLLWTHLPQRDNLFIVFDSVTSRNQVGLTIRKEFLRVVRGADVIEQISLEDLVFQAQVDQEKARSQPIPDASRNIIIMIKRPLIAVRYQLPNDQIRRLQMNFSPDSGYDITLERLSRLGLPILDKNLQQNHSKSSQPIPPVPYFQQYNSGYAMPQAKIGDISPVHKQQQETLSSAANPDVSVNPTPLYTPQATSSSTAGSDQHSEDARRYQLSLEPSPSIVHRGHTSNGRLETLTSTSSTSSGPYQPNVEPTRHPRYDVNPVRQDLFETHDSAVQRPVSAPVSLANMSLDALSQLLPPKRDLPFAEPPRKISRLKTDRRCDPPAKADPFTPPEKKQTISKKKTVQKSKRAPPKASAPKKTLPLVSSAPLTNKDSHSLQYPSVPFSTAPTPASTPTPTARQPLTTLPLTSPPNQQPSAPMPKAAALSLDIDPTFAAHVTNFVSTYATYPLPTPPSVAPPPPPPPPPLPIANLAAYASLPEEERRAGLDTLLCEMVMDEGFLALAEDVEQAWRRVGLGF